MNFRGKQNPIRRHILDNRNYFSFKLRKFKAAARTS